MFFVIICKHFAMYLSPPAVLILQNALELIENVAGGRERRFDGKIIVVGHLMAGKTTLIGRLLLKHLDPSKNERTNGILITRKGAFSHKDGTWTTKDNPKDSQQVLRRMKAAKCEGSAPDYSSHDQKDIARKISDKIQYELKTGIEENLESEEDGRECRLYFMDFAGQSIFNSTHQMFMTNRAVYLLVFDVSKQTHSEVEDDDVYCVGANRRMSVEEFTEFLLSSIHVYSGDQTELFPKVLLVGTHKDQVSEATARKRMTRIKDKFKGRPLQKHVFGDFIVDCSIEDDPDIDHLRQFIFEILQQEPYWGEETPTRWLPLEDSIIDHRENGKRVLTLLEIKQINDECFVKLEDEDEIGKFLQFHNTIGNVIFFGGTAANVIVILDPQWLIDALKQLITHEQFYLIPEGPTDLWKDFNQSAKLHKRLIDAVWGENEDKTFIIHKKQLLNILEQTDIIASPLVYNIAGKAETVDHYIVPSMLRPNQDGKAKIEGLLKHCRTKTPSLCFVFQNRFLQPAIFPRIQAECTSIYKIKELNNQPLMFYQVAVFQLSKKLDLLLEQEGHVIKVTVINENEANMSSEMCKNVRVTLEDALKNIVRLYGGSTVPFYKAVQCKNAEFDTDTLLPWHDLEQSESVLCKAHIPDEWHRVNKTDFLGPWSGEKTTDRNVQHLASKGSAKANNNLDFFQLARLARRLETEDFLIASKVSVSNVDWNHCRLNNKNDIVGQKYDTLVKWRNNESGLTLDAIIAALDSQSNISIEKLKEAVADTDISQKLKEFNPAFLEATVNDEAIDTISQSSATTYKHLALELGITQNTINCVVQDMEGVVHRAKVLLQEWRRNSPSTFKHIARAIIEVDMDIDILRECEEQMKI